MSHPIAARVGLVLVLVSIGLATTRAIPKNVALYVDCAAQPGGDGSHHAPFDTITAAVTAGRTLDASSRIVIDVGAGTCERETLPITLDYALGSRGNRAPVEGEAPDPLRDTVITVPAGAVVQLFLLVTTSNVEVSRLTIDGRFDPGPDTPAMPPPGPTAVLARSGAEFVDGLVLEHLRLVGLAEGIRGEGVGGRIARNVLERTGSGVRVFGGGAKVPPGPDVPDHASTRSPLVVIADNHIGYRVNGITLAGGIPANGATPEGYALRAAVLSNDLVTDFANTGPSNPTAIRLSPSVGGAPGAANPPDGLLLVVATHNYIRGTPRYSILIHAGQPVRTAPLSTGLVSATFKGTQLDEDAQQTSTTRITFTNARATELPCELNPANTRTVCPSLTGNPPIYWDYLQQATFNIWHQGDLDGAAIDHPLYDPVYGRLLSNQLRINDVDVPHQTFVVVPGVAPSGLGTVAAPFGRSTR